MECHRVDSVRDLKYSKISAETKKPPKKQKNFPFSCLRPFALSFFSVSHPLSPSRASAPFHLIPGRRSGSVAQCCREVASVEAMVTVTPSPCPPASSSSSCSLSWSLARPLTVLHNSETWGWCLYFYSSLPPYLLHAVIIFNSGYL